MNLQSTVVQRSYWDAENAGMGNAGPNRVGGKQRTENAGPNFTGRKSRTMPSMEREMDKYKCIRYR